MRTACKVLGPAFTIALGFVPCLCLWTQNPDWYLLAIGVLVAMAAICMHIAGEAA